MSMPPESTTELLASEESAAKHSEKIMLNSHSALLNFIALLNTGGLVSILTWHECNLSNTRALISGLFLLGIYLILLTKFLFFIQNSRIVFHQKKNADDIRMGRIMDLAELNEAKKKQHEETLELLLDCGGILSILLFLVSSIMWLLEFLKCPFAIPIAILLGILITIFPAYFLLDLFKRWEQQM